jgi:hypothetical protein
MKQKACFGALLVGMMAFCMATMVQGGNYPSTPDWVKRALRPGSSKSGNKPQNQNTDTRYQPKSQNWVNKALHPDKHEAAEPGQAFPKPGQPYYLMLCQERPHLYWFIQGGGFFRLTNQGVFRAPTAMCPGPKGGVLVMDLPRLAADATILWQVSNQGHASPVCRWQPGGLIKCPTQMIWAGKQLFISDSDNGLLVVTRDGSVNRLLYPGNIAQEGGQPMGPAKGRFGGICTDGRALYVAQGGYHKTRRRSSHVISFNTSSVPGCVMRLVSGGGASVIGTDGGGALFTPKAMVMDVNGRLFVTDYGQKNHEYAGLKILSQGRLIDVPVRVGNRSLRGPWGISLDRDGALLVADPLMWNARGNSGIALRVVPGGPSQILFSGNGQHRPIAVLAGR